MISLIDPAEGARELRRATEELGLVGAFIPPNPVMGRHLDDPAYFPIYEMAQQLDTPITIHNASGSRLPQAGDDRYSSFGRHIGIHPIEQMLSALTLLGDGVLERFPGLKIAHLESGCGWLPFWLDRIDEHFKHYRWSQGRDGTGSRLPSDIFRAQCVISTEAGEDLVVDVVDRVGEDVLIVATDYPHSDAVDKFPDHTIGDLTRNEQLSDQTKRKILWDNPARIYGISQVPASASGAAPNSLTV
jgi:predicted TIM-barrel fold metal-dependent hydrolase